jgi:hypothetical protein
MVGYTQRLEKLGFPISQELATDFILASLPPSYGNFILNYHMHGAEKGLNELCGMLKTAEANIKKGASSSHVMAVQNKPNFKKKGNYRLGHIRENRMKRLHADGLLTSFDFESYETCEACLLGKMTKTLFTGFPERASDLLELVHTDVCGPMNTTTSGGFQYFITFTDDFSRYGYVYLMKHKSETFERFKEFQNEVENQCGKKIKAL